MKDIYLPLNHLFSEASKKAFEFESTETEFQRERKALANIHKKSSSKTLEKVEARYIGTYVKGQKGIYDGAKKVANRVNELASKGYVVGCLKGAQLFLYELIREDYELEKYFLLSYIILTPAGLKYIEQNPINLDIPSYQMILDIF